MVLAKATSHWIGYLTKRGESLLSIYRLLLRQGRRRQRLAVLARAERIVREIAEAATRRPQPL
jgi:hypothetical protein